MQFLLTAARGVQNGISPSWCYLRAARFSQFVKIEAPQKNAAELGNALRDYRTSEYRRMKVPPYFVFPKYPQITPTPPQI